MTTRPTESTHTAGPCIKGVGFDRHTGGFLAVMADDVEIPSRLIAAAPDLLAALQAMLSALHYNGPDADGFIDSSERIARAAIHRATQTTQPSREEEA